jgi:hypothetical protein
VIAPKPLNKKMISMTPSKETRKHDFIFRIRLTDGSIESFVPADQAEAQRIRREVEPSRLIARTRLVLAGEYPQSVRASSQSSKH